jgi:hypothetical protein
MDTHQKQLQAERDWQQLELEVAMMAATASHRAPPHKTPKVLGQKKPKPDRPLQDEEEGLVSSCCITGRPHAQL